MGVPVCERAGACRSWLVASTFAFSFDKSTEDEKATVDKRDSGWNNWVPDSFCGVGCGACRADGG